MFDSEQEVRAHLSLLKAQRQGRFPEAYADLAAPTHRTLYLEIGAALEDALRRRKGSAVSRIRKVIARLVRRLKAGEDNRLLEAEIEALCDLAARRSRAEREGRTPESKTARTFGAFLALASACEGAGADADIVLLARLTSHMLKGEGISSTDVEGAVQVFTKFIPLPSWIEAFSGRPALAH